MPERGENKGRCDVGRSALHINEYENYSSFNPNVCPA